MSQQIVHVSDSSFEQDVLKSNVPMKFSVRGIPTLILFKNGQLQGQKIGAVRKADVAAFLDSNL